MSEIQPRLVGKFLKSLNSSRKLIVELPFDEAAKSAKDGETLFESLEEGQLYIPFTDCDHYCESIEIPSDRYIEDVYEKMMNNLGRLVNDQFDHEVHRFGIAIRHGVHVEKKVYKLSWRCYFFGFVITLSEMKKAIVKRGLDKAGIGSLDSSPYNKNQLLGCVGFAKSGSDKRVLKPLGEWPLEKFMVQNITGDETVLKYDEIEESAVTAADPMSDDDHVFDGHRFAPPWDVLESAVMSLDVQKRCECGSYQSWARVGWAIAGVARAAKKVEEGLKLWLRFCQRSMETYLEDPMKARLVYFSKSLHQLGWKSLMEALKEDAPIVHKDIENRLSPSLADKEAVKAIEHFVKVFFRRPARQIDRIVIRTYGSDKYFIVTLKQDSGCDFIDGEHEDGTQNHIVLGLKYARNKCSHSQCKALSSDSVPLAQYPEAVKTAAQKHLQVIQTPTDIVQKFVKQHKDSSFGDMADEDLELEEPQSVLFGQKYALTKNTYCQVCRCNHEKPENCIFMNQTATLLAMGCRLNPDNFHPPGGIVIPQNITNIIVNQTVNVLAETHQLEDEVFDEDFAMYPDANLNRLVNKSLKGFASDIARVFVHLGRDRFGVQTGDTNTWWAWDEVEKRWMQSQHKANIFCDEIVAQVYVDVMQWLRSHTPENDKRTKRLQKVEQLLKRLKDRDQHSILAQAAILLKEEKRNFEFMLDSNKDVLNFQGQVFDFETLKVRAVHPSDHVSLTTGYCLPEIDMKKRTRVMEILGSIMPDHQHLDYLLLHLAGCLDGWNREEVFHILTGSGRNGKGILSLLMEHALGKTSGYFKDVKAELLTKDRPSADRPAPELLNTNGKRLIVASEPESGSRINTGFLKFMTGNDPSSGRWLHANTEISFSPQHSLWLLCNSIPSLDAHDEAVWDRSRVLEFPFHFVDSPKCESEKKIDRTLKRAIPKLAPQLMLVLIEAYGKYKREGLNPTPKMLAFTETVRDANDIYAIYIEEMLDITLSSDDRLRKKDVECRCKEWILKHREYKDTVFNKSALETALTKLSVVKKTATRVGGFKGTPQGFHGVRFKDDDDAREDTASAFLPDRALLNC